MPLLLILFGLFVPRLVIFLLWIFSGWFSVIPNALYGILGFLFLPYTLLWYSAVEQWYDGTWGALQIIVLVIALIADLGLADGGRRSRHQ